MKYGSDIAVLKLMEDPPVGSEPGRLVAQENLWRHPFRSFGFPLGLDIGEFAWGIILGELTNGWVQIDGITETGRFVSVGFSGTPVWDEDVSGIVGMIVSAYEESYIKKAYFIPTTILIKVYPDLKQQVIPPCPYRGLSAFQEKDAPYFFGREHFTQELIKSVSKKPFIAIIGPSGSGKSSTVHAGLIPLLKTDQDWVIASFRPEGHPFFSLASTLFPLFENQKKMTEQVQLDEKRKLAQRIRDDDDYLQYVVKHIIEKHPGSSFLLLVADQFEALFTQCQDIQERQRFLDILLLVLRPHPYKQRPDLSLIITLRIDFLKQALLYPSFAEVLQNATKMLIPMNNQELRTAIEKPARMLNVMIEDGLTERIIEAIKHSPGNLPILEFTMTQLWKAHRYGTLTHTAYDDIGGVEKSLAQHAEEIYERFSEEDKERMHRLFIKLVHPGEGIEDTHRIANRTEVEDKNWDLVTRLASERLIVTGKDAYTGEETVELIHEALITEWERFQKWMEVDRVFRIWQDRLQMIVQQWKASGYDEGVLLRGFLLDEAEDWLKKRPADLSKAEAGFIEASLALRKKEQAEREAVRKKEKRLLLLQKRTILGIATGMIVTLILAAIAMAGWIHALNQRRKAEARQLVTLAEMMKSQHPALLPFGTLLAAEAMRLSSKSPSVEFDQALREGLNLLPRPVTHMNHDNKINSVAFSPDGDYVATGSSDNAAILWNAHTGEEVERVNHGDIVNTVAFSSNGRYIATASWDHVARILDRTNENIVLLIGHNNNVNSITFSPDDHFVATASADHTACVWETRTGNKVESFPHEDNVIAVAYSPNGRYLATASWDKRARFWDLSNDKKPILMPHNDKVNDVTFSPDERYLATASSDNTARLWEIESGRKVHILPHDNKVNVVAFSPNGRYLATASSDNTARLWDLSNNGKESARMYHNNHVNMVTFDPNGDYLATASADNTGRIWNIKDVKNVKECIRIAHEGPVTDITFSPNRKYFATASKDKTARIWEFSSIYKDSRIIHEDEVSAVNVSPNRRCLATVSKNHVVILWDISSSQEIKRIKCRPKTTAITLSPELRYLATSGENATIRILDINNNTEAVCIEDKAIVQAIAFSQDGRYISTAFDDDTININKVGSGQRIASIHQKNKVTALALSSNGDYLAVADIYKTAQVWDVRNHQKVARINFTQEIKALSIINEGKCLAVSEGDNTLSVWHVGRQHLKIWQMNNRTRAPSMKHPEEVIAISLSAKGKYLAAAGKDRSLYIWDIEKQQDPILMKQTDDIAAIALSTDGRYLATACKDRIVYVWEIGATEAIPSIKHNDEIFAVAFDPEDQHIFTANKENIVCIWDANSRLVVDTLKLIHHIIETMVFSPDGKYLATSGDDHIVRVWERSTGKRISLISHTGHVNKLAFSPKRRYLATASSDHTIRVWNASSHRIKRMQHDQGVNDATFSPDGKYLATASLDHTARLWEISTGLEKACIKHNSFVKQVAFSPNGKYLATASGDHTIAIWKSPTGRKVISFKHDQGVNDLVFSSDGDYLATGGEDHTARIWKIATGKEVARIRHDRGVNTLAFSIDDKYLATASSDKTIRLSLWKPKDMINEVCTLMPRNLVLNKWYDYFGNKTECKVSRQLQ